MVFIWEIPCTTEASDDGSTFRSINSKFDDSDVACQIAIARLLAFCSFAFLFLHVLSK